MQVVLGAFALVHAILALVFVAICVLLLVVAVRTCWQVLGGELDDRAAVALIETMGLAAVAVVALQIAQTIAEEEVVRGAHVSAPTRVRRFLSRFLVVIVIALSIEGLVATMKALHEDMAHLPQASSAILAVAALVAAWGVFIWCNRAAEDVEPEAMQQAKDEDRKLQ